MKRTIASTLALTALLAAAGVHAQEQTAAAPTGKPADSTADSAAAPAAAGVTWNLGAVTDYRYRGISQTRTHPAIQGGADWTDPASGLYVGTWLSSITWARDAGGGGHVEMDVYAGKRGDLGGGFSYDVGLLGYIYPGNKLGDVPGYVDGDTGELYGQVGYGPVYLKYSNALTNLFGFVDSRYSSYTDLGANLDAGNGFTVILHAGRQHVSHSSNASYTDWKVGVSKAWGPTTATLAWVQTNAQEAAYTSAANGKFLGKNGVVLSVVRTF
jgi:uncharacterized protein (TIGR02001 family)